MFGDSPMRRQRFLLHARGYVVDAQVLEALRSDRSLVAGCFDSRSGLAVLLPTEPVAAAAVAEPDAD
jgi:hypothetical protein